MGVFGLSVLVAVIVGGLDSIAGALVAGLAIVRAHNVWTWGWPVLLTLVGWFFIAGGLARMFFTEAARQGAGDPAIAFATEVALLGLALFLTFKAYAPERGGPGN